MKQICYDDHNPSVVTYHIKPNEMDIFTYFSRLSYAKTTFKNDAIRFKILIDSINNVDLNGLRTFSIQRFREFIVMNSENKHPPSYRE